MTLLTGSRITQSFLLTVKTRKPQCLCVLQSEQRKRMSTNHAAVHKGKPPPSRSAPAIIDMQSTTEEPPLGESELFLRTRDEVSSGTWYKTLLLPGTLTTPKALNTPGMKFADGHGLKGPTGKGRQTRKMNLYQAIRDALGWVYINLFSLSPHPSFSAPP